MVAQISGFNKIAIATAFTLASQFVTMPTQNANAAANTVAPTTGSKCLQGLSEKIVETFKNLDLVDVSLVGLDVLTTGGIGTGLLLWGKMGYGCLKGPSNDSSSNPQRPSAPFEKYGGNWNYGNDK